jgi:hypothetical protein
VKSAVGLSLEERIRRSLSPLCGPLHIDAFLTLMHRERSRKAAEEARRKRAEEERRAAERAPKRTESTGERAAATTTGEQAAAELNDSAHLRAEVAEFMKRDRISRSDAGEVADFMDFLGGGLAPDEPAG